MLGEIGIEIIIIVILALANGFFAGSEIAIVSARRNRLETLADGGKKNARRALNLAENPDRFLATVQVGITLIGTFSAAFGGAQISGVLAESLEDIAVLEPYADGLALLIVVASITYISLVVGELVPKQIALRNAEAMAILAAPVMGVIATVARPIIAVLTVSVNLILRLLGVTDENVNLITEEDIVYMVREGRESGSVEAEEAQIIHRVFQFTDRPVHVIMTPRTQITAIEIDTPLEEVLSAFMSSGRSRLPVYDKTLDQILGVLYIKDLMIPLSKGKTDINIQQMLRSALFVVETAHGDDVMLQFRQKQAHIALVIDEYGQVVGLVTLEDLLEELVGEIRDEFDLGEENPYVRRHDGSWLVDGMEPYDKVRQFLDIGDDDSTEGYMTLAGVVMAELGRLPKVGDTVELEDLSLEVVDMDGRRIDKILVQPIVKDEGDEEAPEE